MESIKVKDNSIFPKITSNFEIFATFPFIPQCELFSYKDIINLVNDSGSSKNRDKIIADIFNINEKQYLFLLVIDKKILILDPINFEKCRFVFTKNESLFFFPKETLEEEFSNFPKKTNFTKEDFVKSFAKSDISYIQIKIINMLILRSQIKTQQRHKTIDSISIDTTTQYKIDDFLRIKIFHNNVQLCYNLNDQFLYILKTFNTNDEESNKYYEREMKFYKTINNKNRFICKFFGTINNEKKNSIVIEYIEGKTLEKFVLNSDYKISPFNKMKFILQILISTEFIHLNDLVLRDLKFDNILIDLNENVIFIDFDRSREIIENDCNNDEITKNFGSEYFLSPEQFLKGEYSFKSDIYTIGILIHFILSEKIFDKTINLSILNDLYNSKKTILNEKTIFFAPEEFEFLFEKYKKCLEFECNERPNITELFYSIFYCINFYYKEKTSQILNSLNNIRTEQLMHFFGVFTFDQNEFTCDVKKFINYLIIASNSNDSYAQSYLGKMYSKGKHLPFDMNKSMYYLNLSFNQNNSYAQFYLGYLFYYGELVQKNINLATNYFYLSANQKNKYAECQLGIIYLTNKEYEKSFYYFKRSADQNYPLAQNEIGYRYYEGLYVKRDINLSIYYLSQAAEQGDEDSCIKLAKIYLNHNYIKINLEKALYYLEIAAKKNNPDALFFIASIYITGIHTKRDIPKSMHYLNLSSKLNCPAAHYYLGLFHLDGIYIPKDISKSIHYLKLAASNKIYDAACIIASIYFDGKFIKPDIEKSIYYAKIASDHGISKAHYLLGLVYYQKKYNKFNINKAIHYFTLASSEYVEANIFIGYIYSEGIYVQYDIDKAIYHYKLAADKNNNFALYLLGNIYYFGRNNIKKDFKKAFNYYLSAAKFGNINAHYYLGYIYYNGENFIKRDVNKGIEYLKIAAMKKHDESECFLGTIYCFSDKFSSKHFQEGINYLQNASEQNNSIAQYKLGLIYYLEKYKKHDINKAIYYFTLAANNNNHDAEFYLGNIYFHGDLVPRDIKKAIYYFKNCSSFGNCNAKNNLGIIYLKGESVDKNIGYAIAYFKEAIYKENNPYSLYNLARLFYFGIGVEKNVDKSIKLLEKAAQQHLFLAIIILIVLFFNRDEEEIKIKTKNYFELLKIYYGDFFHSFFSQIFKNYHMYGSFFIKVFKYFEIFDLTYPFTRNNFFDFFTFNDLAERNIEKKETKIISTNITNDFYNGFDIDL